MTILLSPKNIMWSAINLSLIVLLLLIGQPIYGQTPLDSTYQWAEMEDSVSGMTMKLVDQPEVLLKRCLWRLEADSKVKHSKRQYRIKNVYGKNSLYPGVSATAIMTVENDNGLTLTGPSARNKYSKIHIETPYTLRDDDVANIQFIFYRLEAAITFLHRGLRKYENNEILPYYDGLIEFHDITAYSIEDEKGRGVYRIDFIERKFDILDEIRVHLVHRGQRIKAPPGVIAVGPAVEGIPAVERRLLGIVSTFAGEVPFPVKVQTVGAGMGINTVQNHLDALFMGGIAHGSELCLGAQHGIYGLVIAGVIAVTGEAFADGVQIDDLHTQRGDVVHLLDDALEVAAVEVVVQHQTFFGRLPVHFLVPASVDGVWLQLAGQIALAGFGEPVREDLIDQCTLGPVGGGEVCRDTADLPAVTGLHVGFVADFEQAEAAGSGGDPEEIEKQTALRKAEGTLENVVGSLLLRKVHQYRLGGCAMLMVDDALDLGGLNGGGDVDVQRTDLIGDQCTERIFVLKLLAVKQNAHNGLL